MMTMQNLTINSTRGDYVSLLRVLAERSLNDRSARTESAALSIKILNGGLLSRETDAELTRAEGSNGNATPEQFSKFLHDYADAVATAGDGNDTWKATPFDFNDEARRLAISVFQDIAGMARANGSLTQLAVHLLRLTTALDEEGTLTSEEQSPIFGKERAASDFPSLENLARVCDQFVALLQAKSFDVDMVTPSFDDDSYESIDSAPTSNGFASEAETILAEGKVNPKNARRLAVATLHLLAEAVNDGRYPFDAAANALDNIAHAAVDEGMLDHDLYHVMVARATAENEPSHFNLSKLIGEVADLLAKGGEAENVGGEEPAPSAEAIAKQFRALAEDATGGFSSYEHMQQNGEATRRVGLAAIKAGYITDDRYEEIRTKNFRSAADTLNRFADEIDKNAKGGEQQSKVA